jgi:hypothetical protein
MRRGLDCSLSSHTYVAQYLGYSRTCSVDCLSRLWVIRHRALLGLLHINSISNTARFGVHARMFSNIESPCNAGQVTETRTGIGPHNYCKPASLTDIRHCVEISSICFTNCYGERVSQNRTPMPTKAETTATTSNSESKQQQKSLAWRI